MKDKWVTVEIDKIDLALLKDQKHQLLCIKTSQLTTEQDDAVQGMINLIDAIQDYAVDVLGMDKYQVFNLTKDEEE